MLLTHLLIASDGVLSVVLDHRLNSSCDTGRFELIHRATTNPNTKGCDTRFVVAGQRINKVDLQRYLAIDRKVMQQQQQQELLEAAAPSARGSQQCNRISLVQKEWSTVAPPGECEYNSTPEQPSAATATTTSVQRTTTASASPQENAVNKMYRGLRPSTVQIYNGRWT